MRKSESPDFLFENEITWGVEITQATNPHYQKQLTEMEEGNFECILQGDGWVGNGPEREAYSEILRAIEAKIKKIEKYQDASRHDLLIYVDIEPFFYNSDKAIDMLRPQVKQLSSHCEKVGKISIIAHNYIYYDIVGDAIRMKQYDYATC